MTAPRALQGLSRTGLAIVAVAALVVTLNSTAKYLATKPLAEWLAAVGHELVRYAFIGVAILLAAVWARNSFPARGITQYAAAGVAVVIATAAALFAIIGWDSGGTFGLDDPDLNFVTITFELGMELFGLSFIGLVIASAWLYLCAEAEDAAAAAQCAVDAERLDRETAEARLQVLEAQIEPHFLFNTLAHVKRLYEIDHAAGARMLHNLAAYLAGALPQMRAASTLGREVDHVSAYLHIQQIRMGARLAFEIEVPAALRVAPLPPLMVLTLVENAIKHGLSPLPQGGRIDIRAFVVDGRLSVEVADTGQGFAKSSGGGTGLANTRARLASRYGDRASLTLALNTPRGVVATVSLPNEAGVQSVA